MSYIPPHKRHLKDPVRPTPIPDYLVTKLKENLNFRRSRITYSGDSISKWFLFGFNGIADEVPPSVQLVPVSSNSSVVGYGTKPLVLMNNKVQKEDKEEKTRWLLVAEKVEDDLLLAYEGAKKEMESHHLLDNAKLRLAARFGKIIFQERPYSQIYFTTDVPVSFIQNIKSKAIPSHEFCIDKEKETYIVKVSHYTRPNATFRCKCIMKKDGRLTIYKTELNPIRHLVVDVSCIDKNLDVRLMLSGKKKITVLTEKEMSDILLELNP